MGGAVACESTHPPGLRTACTNPPQGKIHPILRIQQKGWKDKTPCSKEEQLPHKAKASRATTFRHDTLLKKEIPFPTPRRTRGMPLWGAPNLRMPNPRSGKTQTPHRAPQSAVAQPTLQYATALRGDLTVRRGNSSLRKTSQSSLRPGMTTPVATV